MMEALREMGSVLMMAEEIVVIVSAILGGLAMFLVMSYLLEVVACWRIFQKAGQGGWKSLIPVYSNYVRYQIAWRPLWLWVSAALFVVSFAIDLLWESAVADGLVMALGGVGFLIHLAANYHLGRAFGRGVLFSLGMMVFPPLFTLILGLGGSEYQAVAAPKGDGSGQEETGG